MKVYELSKELNIESKELLELLKELNIDVTSHMNNLTDKQIQMIRTHLDPSDKTPSPKEDNKEKSQKWQANLDRMICVENVSPGKLIYKSKRQMGYKIVWNEPGDTNYVELEELVNLKNTNTRFVREPWIRIVEEDEYEILQYLNVLQFYRGILGIDNLASILKLTDKHTFKDFKAKFDRLPKSYKESAVTIAAEMIKNGSLDSIRVKQYIEQEMNTNLDVLIQSGSMSIKTQKPQFE